LFGMSAQTEASPAHYLVQPDWHEDQRLSCEKQTLGLYLTGHPIERYLDELGRFVTARIVDLKPTNDQTVVVAGLIIAMRSMNTKRGDRMAFITIDDRSARIELAVFSESYQRYRDLLAKDKLIVVEGEVSVDEYSGGYKMSARSIYDINQAREHFARKLILEVDEQRAANGFIKQLQSTLAPFREGGCPVSLAYLRDGARAEIALGDAWRVHPTDELIHRLKEVMGDGQVRLVY